jgi:hypothetical protein
MLLFILLFNSNYINKIFTLIKYNFLLTCTSNEHNMNIRKKYYNVPVVNVGIPFCFKSSIEPCHVHNMKYTISYQFKFFFVKIL